MEKIDINKMVFSNTPSENKLHYIKTLSKEEIRETTESTILRIYNECHGDRDKFYIDSDRRVGNRLGSSSGFWNSLVEYIYKHNGHAYIGFYVQNTKTDWGESVSYNTFTSRSEFSGYCDYLHTSFRYDSTDVANVIRCILAEYVYYTEIEKAERERKKKMETIGGNDVLAPVFNYFFSDLRLDKLPWSYMTTTSDYTYYCNGKKAVQKYIEEHAEELFGKTKEELIALYKEVFRKGM